MKIETTEMWEILLPWVADPLGRLNEQKLEDWLKEIAVEGITVYSTYSGYWKNTNEKTIAVRIACDQIIIEKIMEQTLTFYDQECIMVYKVAGTCLMGHREIKEIPPD